MQSQITGKKFQKNENRISNDKEKGRELIQKKNERKKKQKVVRVLLDSSEVSATEFFRTQKGE